MFTSYEHVKAYYDTARNKSKGKPLASRMRLYQHDEGLCARFAEHTFAVYRPDDTVEFVMPEKVMRGISHSLAHYVTYAGSFTLRSKGRGIFEIGYLKRDDNKWYRTEYFPGIKFNLATGTRLNPRPPLAHRVDPANNLVWRRALRWMKRELVLREKLGVVEAIRRTSRPHVWCMSEEVLDMLYKTMRNKQFEHDDFVKLVSHFAYTSLSPSDMIYYLCTHTYNIELRKRFGVFKEV